MKKTIIFLMGCCVLKLCYSCFEISNDRSHQGQAAINDSLALDDLKQVYLDRSNTFAEWKESYFIYQDEEPLADRFSMEDRLNFFNEKIRLLSDSLKAAGNMIGFDGVFRKGLKDIGLSVFPEDLTDSSHYSKEPLRFDFLANTDQAFVGTLHTSEGSEPLVKFKFEDENTLGEKIFVTVAIAYTR